MENEWPLGPKSSHTEIIDPQVQLEVYHGSLCPMADNDGDGETPYFLEPSLTFLLMTSH